MSSIGMGLESFAAIDTSLFTIVCVDDEQDFLDVQAELFRSWGFQVFASVSVAAVTEFVAHHQAKVALVLSDIRMPECDGFELRRALVEIAPDVPFAIISGFVDREMALRGLDLKIAGFLEKPFEISLLKDLFIKDVKPRILQLIEDQELLTGFLAEARELLTSSEDILLHFGMSGNEKEAFDSLFGYIHTLKGASSFFQPKSLHQFAHRFEDYLKKIQSKELRLTNEFISAFLAGVDVMRGLLDCLEKGSTPLTFSAETEVVSVFKAALESTAQSPEEEKPEQKAPDASETHTKAVAGAPHAELKNDIRVPAKDLENLLQNSGEMTVVRNMINKIAKTLERKHGADKDVLALCELLDEFQKINVSVQEQISSLRKVSLKSVFKPLQRATRDIAHQLGKQIDLHTAGEELMIDTQIADLYSKILLHLVKNCIDHGIEPESKRITAEKSVRGKISLSAKIQNDIVLLEIEDDGAGINEAALKRKAIESGALSAAQTEKLSSEETWQLIFQSGVSTAEAVTDISGRGVGMSMVKETIEQAGGHIHIESKSNIGTKFIIRLPLPQSVLIADCLFVRSNDHTWGIPQVDINRILKLDQHAGALRTIDDAYFLDLDNEMIPIFSISEFFGNPRHPCNSSQFLLILQSSRFRHKIALRVDEVFEIEATVIKKILPKLNHQDLLWGASFLEDGQVGLILNTTSMLALQQTVAQTRSDFSEGTEKLASTTQKLPFKGILFETNDSCHYAFPQDQVHRIELIDRKNLHFLYGECFLTYWGKSLRVFDLTENSSQPVANLNSDSLKTPMIITYSDDGDLFGFLVSHIHGFSEGSAIDRTFSFTEGTLGTSFVEEKICTVYDANVLAPIKKRQQKSLSAAG